MPKKYQTWYRRYKETYHLVLENSTRNPREVDAKINQQRKADLQEIQTLLQKTTPPPSPAEWDFLVALETRLLDLTIDHKQMVVLVGQYGEEAKAKYSAKKHSKGKDFKSEDTRLVVTHFRIPVSVEEFTKLTRSISALLQNPDLQSFAKIQKDQYRHSSYANTFAQLGKYLEKIGIDPSAKHNHNVVRFLHAQHHWLRDLQKTIRDNPSLLNAPATATAGHEAGVSPLITGSVLTETSRKAEASEKREPAGASGDNTTTPGSGHQ